MELLNGVSGFQNYQNFYDVIVQRCVNGYCLAFDERPPHGEKIRQKNTIVAKKYFES